MKSNHLFKISLNQNPIKIYSLRIILLFVMVITFLLGKNVAIAAPDDQKVYDYYGLFSDEEVAKLEELCSEYGKKGQIDIVIITTDDLSGRSREEYLEDFYDEYGFGYEKEFGTSSLMLINMEPGNRGVQIANFGNAEYYVTDDRTEYILDDIVPKLSDQEYFDAVKEYIKQVEFYMHEEDFNTYYKGESILNNAFVQLGIAMVIGAIVVGIMAYHSSGRITVNSHTYLDEKNSRVIASRDDYIRTTTTRVRKPSNNQSGGGRSSGGGGVSKAGHSHSGGGRSF